MAGHTGKILLYLSPPAPRHFCIAVNSHWSQEGHATVLIVYRREGLLPTMCFHAILSFGNVLLLYVSHHPAEAAVTGVYMDGWKHILVYGVYGVWMDGSICPLCSTCSVAALFCSISTAYGLKLIAYSNAILYIIANILLYYHPSNAVLTNITKWYILLHLSCTRL